MKWLNRRTLTIFIGIIVAIIIILSSQVMAVPVINDHVRYYKLIDKTTHNPFDKFDKQVIIKRHEFGKGEITEKKIPQYSLKLKHNNTVSDFK